MSKRSAILLIQDMLEAIEKIRRYTAGLIKFDPKATFRFEFHSTVKAVKE